MQRISGFHSSEPDRLLGDPHDFYPQNVSSLDTADPAALRVLSVGRMDEVDLAREAFNRSPRFSLTHASDYRELWNLSKRNEYDAVVLQSTLSSFELEGAARLVRRRWPAARIVLLRGGEIALDDPLYDLRVRPPVDITSLMFILSGQTRPAIPRPRPHLRTAQAAGG